MPPKMLSDREFAARKRAQAYSRGDSQGNSRSNHGMNNNHGSYRHPYGGHSNRGNYGNSHNGRGYGSAFDGNRGRDGSGPRAPSEGDEEWRLWTELTVRLFDCPPLAGTREIYNLLSPFGYIQNINLEEDRTGRRNGQANIVFSPPPNEAFWQNWKPEDRVWATSRVRRLDPKRTFKYTSPVDPAREYPEHQMIISDTIDFGFWSQPGEMMVMRTIGEAETVVLLNLLRKELLIHFSHVTRKARESYKIQIPLVQIQGLMEVATNEDRMSLILPLDGPSLYFRKLHKIDITFDDSRKWNERKTWYRQTDMVEDPRATKKVPLELRKRNPIVDIGRWTTLRFNFNLVTQRATYDMIRQTLCDHNVVFTQPKIFRLLPKKENTFWNHISETSLSWALRYQLDVCISQSVLLEENISEDFIKALLKMPEREAIQRLEYAVSKKDRVFDPTTLLGVHVPYRSMAYTRIPAHCILSRSANVTPSTIYLTSPAVEMSNRILRQYKDHADRFLRVRFTDEKHEGRIQSVDDESNNAIFNRVFGCMFNGINIGGRHYEFLAMGNSQFREHGAYFFASQPGVMTAAQIRATMGEFSHIKVVAKWASRLGQCFSTTRAIRGTKVKIVEIDDVERETYVFSDGVRKKTKYNFTDGVGKMSPEVASIVASEMGIASKIGEPPSVFQVRLGGIKGVLAISPDSKEHEVHIRPSQYKFPALHEGLEIIRYSSFSSVVLNRQLITVLRALQVPPGVFLKKMKEELNELHRAMTDSDVALAKLQHRIDFNQMTLTLAETVADGFLDANEPFITSCLRLWRVWYHKSLKEKAGLTISKGAFVLGCVDETATLRGYHHQAMHSGLKTREQRTAALPQIFIQVDPLRTGAYKVIKGICLVGRNPSLHPGDIRVVEAIDVPALHHLRDVVVFSQLGDRDVPSMCSGGDLDGDDFVVIWDETLIPSEAEWDTPAMDFTGPSPLKVNRAVEITDVIPFFVQYMKTDKLRSIATSHLANADLLEGGIRHPRCLELAELHSIAVDYPKSGVPALMSQDLRPFKFPHFMPSKFRAADRLYRSNSVLGTLYDMVDPLNFEPVHDKPFDERILNAYENIDPNVLSKAREIKDEYDAGMRRVMAQQEIATEFEVWTTFVLDHARIISDYKFHEEIGALASMLRERFQETVYSAITEMLKKAGGEYEYSKDGPEVLRFVVAMYKITAEEVAKWQTEKAQTQDPTLRASLQPPLISYPWLFQRELCKIAASNARPKRTADASLRQTGKNIWKSNPAKNAWDNDAKSPVASMPIEVVMAEATSAPQPTPPAPVLIDFGAGEAMAIDDVETAAGVVKHRGDLLELFQGMSNDSPDISRPQSTVHGDVDMDTAGEELTDGLDDDFDTLMAGDGKAEELADRELMSAWSLRSKIQETQEAGFEDDDEDGNGEVIMGMDEEDDEMAAKIERLHRMGA